MMNSTTAWKQQNVRRHGNASVLLLGGRKKREIPAKEVCQEVIKSMADGR